MLILRLMAGKRQRGSVEERPGGSLRVRVYAGTDPLTGKEHYLREVIENTPDKWQRAEAARTKLLNQVDERKHPRTSATIQQLLDKHLPKLHIEETTRRTYRRYIKKHVLPLIGETKLADVDAELLDSYYAELLRCRNHCVNPRQIEHRADDPHDCDARCKTHSCEPLAAWTVRKIHFILSGAFERANRWNWIGENPFDNAEPPAPPPPNPTPPTPAEAARLLNAAWQDLDFGTLVWTVMVTGCRRGEICRVRWRHFDPERKVLQYSGNLAQDGTDLWDKETKSGQGRNVALDDTTVAVLSDYRDHREQLAAKMGVNLSPDAYIFSPAPDGSDPLKPASLGQRYNRLATRLGIKTTIHKLRHYSATELISGGVDIRTVAGRLGHAGGGTTTLKIYTAWVTEADQRASQTLLSRVPERPGAPLDPIERAKENPQAPYEHIAAGLRAQILDGLLADGDQLPTVKEVAAAHGVAESTANRAIGLLRTWGLVSARRGTRTVVTPEPEPELPELDTNAESMQARQALDLEILHRGSTVRKLRTDADPNDTAQLNRLLTDAVLRLGGDENSVREYEMNVRSADSGVLFHTYVAT